MVVTNNLLHGLTLTLTLAAATTASVVILPGGDPLPLKLFRPTPADTALHTILRDSAPSEFPNATIEILLSSYSGTLVGASAAANSSEISPSSDSFVRGAIQAWGEHLNLEIRPDEVWFTILTQLNFYMQTHAEEVRHLFVSHEGRQTIEIEDTDWMRVLLRFKDEIQKRVKTPWLSDWIVPDFSTTTEDDVMTANVLMMGLMKAYFNYEGTVICGLPSVTLLGEKADWEKLLARLDHLSDFGKEPNEYRSRMEPILKRFVRSFDEPDSDDIRKFWNQIAFAKEGNFCGAAPLEVSGWITGFLFWDGEGKRWEKGGTPVVTIDEVGYTMHDIRTFPVGYARAPFTMARYYSIDRFPAYVAAGTLGKRMVEGAPEGYAAALARAGKNTSQAADAKRHGTLRPLSAWMLYGPLNHNVTIPKMQYDPELSLIIRNQRGCRSDL